MQLDPIKPTLKAPGSKRLKLHYDASLSTFAFRFNLRRHKAAKFEAMSVKNKIAHNERILQH